MIRNFLREADYENGYTQALLDVKNWFERHSNSLRYYRLCNTRCIPLILNCMMKNHTRMMDRGEDFEIVWRREEMTDTRVKEYCPETGKICYSQKAAGDIIRNAKTARGIKAKQIPQRSYRCQFCGSWHVTHFRNLETCKRTLMKKGYKSNIKNKLQKGWERGKCCCLQTQFILPEK